MKQRKRDIYTFLLYILGLLLLLEWIWPVEQLTNTSNVSVFLVFLAVSLLFSFLQVPMVMSALLKGGLIAYFLHSLYFEGSFLQIDWIFLVVLEIVENISFLYC